MTKTKTYAPEAAKPEALTASQRQRRFRLEKKNAGLHEVRSIHAFREDHAAIKSFANDLTAKTRAAKAASKA